MKPLPDVGERLHVRLHYAARAITSASYSQTIRTGWSKLDFILSSKPLGDQPARASEDFAGVLLDIDYEAFQVQPDAGADAL